MFHGIVVDQSQSDQSLLKDFKIFAKKQDDDWGIYGIEIEDIKLDAVIDQIQKNIKTNQPWYSHFYKDDQLIVIFKNRIFRVRPDKSTWTSIIDYGKRLNIPPEQLDFQPCRFTDEKYYFS